MLFTFVVEWRVPVTVRLAAREVRTLMTKQAGTGMEPAGAELHRLVLRRWPRQRRNCENGRYEALIYLVKIRRIAEASA